jgi:putative addiction module killer protein
VRELFFVVQAQDLQDPGVVDTTAYVAYKLHMLDVKRSKEFDRWLKGLMDTKAKAKVLVRVERLGLGNPGDVGPVGEGISEMRIDFGPGYRVYYKQQDDTAILLCGGDKGSQNRDIRKAKKIASGLED